MRYATKKILLTAMLVITGHGISAQQPSGKNIDWAPLVGKNNEFVVYFPNGFQTVNNRNFTRDGITIRELLTVFRVLNGTILLMEYYQGDAKALHKLEQGKLTPSKNMTVGEFQKWDYLPEKETWSEVQHYLIKDRLYVLKSTKLSGTDPIAKAFFESVHVNIDNTLTATNASVGVPSTSLPVILEKEPARVGDDQVFDLKDVDRKPIVIYSARPSSTRENATVTLRAVLSASGQVDKIEILRSSSDGFAQNAIAAARKTIFIPAEKDGKLVSTSKNFEYSSSFF